MFRTHVVGKATGTVQVVILLCPSSDRCFGVGKRQPFLVGCELQALRQVDKQVPRHHVQLVAFQPQVLQLRQRGQRVVRNAMALWLQVQQVGRRREGARDLPPWQLCDVVVAQVQVRQLRQASKHRFVPQRRDAPLNPVHDSSTAPFRWHPWGSESVSVGTCARRRCFVPHHQQ